MPTKTEQSDLLLAMFGRHGESPLVVLAPATPVECYEYAFEACRLALEFMTPVILLSDGYIANGAEPWLIPNSSELPEIKCNLVNPVKDQDKPFLPYSRNENLVRQWALPGTAGYEHRLSGLEGHTDTGNISYDPINHEKMTDARANKIQNIENFIPELKVHGPEKGDVLVLGWGGTYGSIRAAVEELQKEGKSVAHAQVRYLNPFPKNIEKVLRSYKKVICPEINSGQLSLLLRSKFLIDIKPFNKVQGQPFKVSELKQAIQELL
jgi:2-oxoglutarate ferredoxin oxidoreductase subunit alpha